MITQNIPASGSPVKSETLKVASRVHTNLIEPWPARFRNIPGYTDFARCQVKVTNNVSHHFKAR